MDPNSDKKGSVAEAEQKVTIPDMSEGDLAAGLGEKPTSEERFTDLAQLIQSRPADEAQMPVWQAEMKAKMKNHAEAVSRNVGRSCLSQITSWKDKQLGERSTGDESSTDAKQLVKSRLEDLKQKQMARRAAWQEQVKAELDKRAEFKLQMEGIPQNQITKGKDRQSLSNISKEWRKKFRPQRTQFLFNEVFPILSKQNVLSNDVFDCRLVCKEWKDAVDNWLSVTSANNYERSADPCEVRFEPNCITFFSLGKLQYFNGISRPLRRPKYSGMNPFLFRQLVIGNPPHKYFNPFWSPGSSYWIEMEKLLKRWGKQIWMAVYAFDDGSIEMMYEFLIRYLSLMPNLRELTITERDRSEYLGKDGLGSLKLRIERKPLPELPHLRSVEFQNFSPAPLVEAMLAKYGDILESFDIAGPVFDKYSGEYLDLGQFVAGRELPLRNYSCIYTNSSRITQWIFQFPLLNELSLDYINANDGPEIENIFKTVNSCGSSIRRLRLKIHFDVPDRNLERDWRDLLPPGMKLDLPHLEWLDLVIERSKITDVDFLLPLVSLKEMAFSYLTMRSDASAMDGKGLIQFIGYRDRFYDSNLWNLLPEIKLVAIHSTPVLGPPDTCLRVGGPGDAGFEYPSMTTTVHTRDGYRQHHCDKNEIQLLTEQLTAFTTK